jgi:hypothetical protein
MLPKSASCVSNAWALEPDVWEACCCTLCNELVKAGTPLMVEQA